MPLSLSFISTNLKKKKDRKRKNALLKGQKPDISSCMFEMFHKKLYVCVDVFLRFAPHCMLGAVRKKSLCLDRG